MFGIIESDALLDFNKSVEHVHVPFKEICYIGSLESIPINLWGELSKLDIFEGDLVVINGARVSNFGGRSLNCG